MIDEGYTKYKCNWQLAPALSAARIHNLNGWRNHLCRAGLVGYDEEHGVGFGNLSVRVDGGMQFIISGTQTGRIPHTDETHYSLVTACDIGENRVTCEGPVPASSEALTHAALYELDEEICAIVHVHSLKLWRTLMHQVPTTAGNVRYGTPEMAREFLRLYQQTELPEIGVVVMAGHEEGIVAFGRTLEQAAQRILEFISGAEPQF